MSLTNTYETYILKKLTGLEKVGLAQSGTAWPRPKDVTSGNVKTSGKLQLKLFTSAPGEAGDTAGVVTTNLFITPYGQYSIGANSAVFVPQFPNPLPTDVDQYQFFDFGNGAQETAADVTSIGLCDANGSVIWSESLSGSAVRKYKNIDQLKLTRITFGFSGNAICKDLATYILNHIFTDAVANTFPELSRTYLTFYNGDPGFNGTDATEQGTRLALGELDQDRDNSWTVSGGTASNTNRILHSFSTPATVTHVALRGASASGEGDDKIYWRGPLLSPQKLEASDTLAILPGQLALSID
jgi:hypothetical protein